jgi:hypothetical protein
MKKIWDFVSNIGYSSDMSYEEARRIKLLCRLNSISFIVLLIYLLVELLLGIYTFIPIILTMELLVGIDLLFLCLHYYKLAKNMAVITVSICIGFFMLYTGDNFNEALFVPLSIMPLIIFKNRKVAFFYLFYLLACMVVCKKLQTEVTPLIKLTPEQMSFFRLLNISNAMVVTYFMTFYFKAANEEYESTLVEMNEIITEKNKEITDSINYARNIQQTLLPSEKSIQNVFDRLYNGKS